jgi:hypothetical protein
MKFVQRLLNVSEEIRVDGSILAQKITTLLDDPSLGSSGG